MRRTVLFCLLNKNPGLYFAVLRDDLTPYAHFCLNQSCDISEGSVSTHPSPLFANNSRSVIVQELVKASELDVRVLSKDKYCTIITKGKAN